MNNTIIMINYAHKQTNKRLVVSRSCTCIRLLHNMTTYVKNHSEGGRFNPRTPNTVTTDTSADGSTLSEWEKTKKYSKIHHIHTISITNDQSMFVWHHPIIHIDILYVGFHHLAVSTTLPILTFLFICNIVISNT